ncbi:hypothetical protein OVA24_04895 [Luteolibacter sp. SL250]|uniref:hypothetical protein n=1 Tax=Luteolibacter sp. SL250 TaxID=2995170 RepID=UPI00226DDDC8|nr:hypothetical protein [Luteolibacter sp. SL250]WAC20717.1 hypothetical protein OVA24_04895 [Luteolibacter sp. SL250]
MLKRIALLLVPVLASAAPEEGAGLDGAEVKIPYSELKRLLAKEPSQVEAAQPPPVLLSAKFTLVDAEGGPQMEAEFQVAAFGEKQVGLPLMKAGLGVEVLEPADANVIVRDGDIQLLLDKPGRQSVRARLLPQVDGGGFSFFPAGCPLVTFGTGPIRGGRSVRLASSGRVSMLGEGQSVPLVGVDRKVEVGFVSEEEMREATKPPEPSVWAWRHEALVLPGESTISYRVISRASASSGSGVAASLVLPAGARGVKVTGDDLVDQNGVVGGDTLVIGWKTRGLLEREISLSYEVPRRSPDRGWKLQVPAGPASEETFARYFVRAVPALSYTAEGLSGPVSPRGLPEAFARELNGASCYEIEGGAEVALAVTRRPVAAVSDAIMDDAAWSVKVEPDGAVLLEGLMTVSHGEAAVLLFDTPTGLSLLKCSLNGQPVAPVSHEGGKLELALPANGPPAKVECSFTGRIGTLDPVEGTFSIGLPQTPMFIRALQWKIDLPPAYQAEISGNVMRMNPEAGEPPSRVVVRKNLCRDERPEAHVFYTRKNPGF